VFHGEIVIHVFKIRGARFHASLWDRLSGLASPLFTGLRQSSRNLPFLEQLGALGNIATVYDPSEFLPMLNRDAHPAHRPLPPVMSVISASKSSYVGYAFIEEQRAAYASLVSTADVIAIIGIRVREHDAHLWNPLVNAQGRVYYCSGQTAGLDYGKWAERHRSRKDDVIWPGYFADHFDDICQIAGLRSPER
jgi:hypothetical protein